MRFSEFIKEARGKKPKNQSRGKGSGKSWTTPFKLSDVMKQYIQELPKQYVDFAMEFLLGRRDPQTPEEKNIAADIRTKMGGVGWKRQAA